MNELKIIERLQLIKYWHYQQNYKFKSSHFVNNELKLKAFLWKEGENKEEESIEIEDWENIFGLLFN